MFEIFNPCEDKAFAENSEISTLELNLLNKKLAITALLKQVQKGAYF